MTYNKKIRALLGIIGALVLLLAASYVFDSERSAARNSLYTWLDKKFIDQVDRIELGSPQLADSELSLVYRDGRWQAVLAGELFPAKEERVGDLLALLSRRANYPVRASSAASAERLGVSEGAAYIRLYGGANPAPLLELFIGGTDALGSEVYIRKSGAQEVRSGERSFVNYAESRRQSWYDLRLFQAEAALSVDQVQRAEIRYASDSGQAPMILARDNGTWTVNGRKVESAAVESYVRTIVSAEADDFVPSLKPSDPFFNQGTISLDTGDGGRRSLSLGPGLEDGKRGAGISDSPYVYALAEWTVGRLFRAREEFLPED
ncbi:MAG: DUF4340 domain-containing protein [Spirochaetaceae bacterium]|nr:DUF4340 domain-containing protein [Spirochaetaceae bacterium]